MIGLCAFGFRFNNFYSDAPHSFITQMTDVLMESGKRAGRLSIENKLRVFSAAQNLENVKAMHALCDEIIADRVAHPQPDSVDLLNPMLEGKDPETGEKMSMESIRFNMVTFLVRNNALLKYLAMLTLPFRSPAMKPRVERWAFSSTTYSRFPRLI